MVKLLNDYKYLYLGQSSLHSLNKSGLFMYWYNIWDTKKNYTKITLENLLLNKFINIFFKNRYYLSHRIFNKKTLLNFNTMYTYVTLLLSKKLIKINRSKIKKNYTLFLEYKSGYNFIKNNSLIPVYCMKLYIFRFKSWIILKYSLYLPKNFKIILKKFRKNYKKFYRKKKFRNSLFRFILLLNNTSTLNNSRLLRWKRGRFKEIELDTKNQTKMYKFKRVKFAKKRKRSRTKYTKPFVILKRQRRNNYRTQVTNLKAKSKNYKLHFSTMKFKFFKNLFFLYFYILIGFNLQVQSSKINILTLNRDFMFLKKKKIFSTQNFVTRRHLVLIHNPRLFYKNKILRNITIKKLNLFIYIFKYKFKKFCQTQKYPTDFYKNKRTYYQQIKIKNKILYKKYEFNL